MNVSSLNTHLFRPIAGDNGPHMLALLVELDAFLDPAQLIDEPTPSQVRGFIRDYIANHNLRIEIESGESNESKSAPEQYTYSRLRDTGWLREERESGYRYVVWMSQDGRRLLNFLQSMSAEHPSLGIVCLSVRSNLAEVVKDPTSGSLIRKAADDMESFLNRMRALVGNIREIHHQLNHGSSQVNGRFEFYFNEYLGELFLPNIEKLALKGNPKLHGNKILKLANIIRFDSDLLEECVKAYKRSDIANSSKDLVENDLDRLSKAFEGIEPLFAKTQDYARRITRRIHEQIKYTVHTPSNIGQQIQFLLEKIGQDDSVNTLPSLSIGEELISCSRLAKPKSKPIEPSESSRRQQKPLWEKRAYNQLKQEHIDFQKCSLERVDKYLEDSLRGRTQVTTDELTINSPDEMMAALHLRLLAQGIPKTHVLHPLQEKYHVSFDDEEAWTTLEAMAGRRLIIRIKDMEIASYGK
ncbi:hypothetical protein H4F18_11115 [Vibrio scophthalmi]|uniref:Wadjet anti-phage system protein JetA family protein n=2 Tax=Vibrio TaxID=662 RepID=UPI002FF1ED56